MSEGRHDCQCCNGRLRRRRQFEKVVRPQLLEGAQSATAECVATAQRWRTGMHWMTYWATTRRDGLLAPNESPCNPPCLCIIEHQSRPSP
jgi:hypothetical protein